MLAFIREDAQGALAKPDPRRTVHSSSYVAVRGQRTEGYASATGAAAVDDAVFTSDDLAYQRCICRRFKTGRESTSVYVRPTADSDAPWQWHADVEIDRETIASRGIDHIHICEAEDETDIDSRTSRSACDCLSI